MYFCQMGHNFTFSQPFDRQKQIECQKKEQKKIKLDNMIHQHFKHQQKHPLQLQDQLQVILMWKNQN